jgi:5-formyltetrahydrofolate cyclo-ligase
MEIVMTDRGRWAGRNPAKDELRNAIWDQLVEDGVAIGPARSHIPNFTGADIAAWHMTQIPAWKTAKAVKVNPDSAQYSLRLRALYEGKTLYCPVPELVQSAPYVRIDPVALKEKGITFELAASHQGYMHHGERIEFTDIPELDFCVFGSVAAAGHQRPLHPGGAGRQHRHDGFRLLDGLRRHRTRADHHQQRSSPPQGHFLGPCAARSVRIDPIPARIAGRLGPLEHFTTSLTR